MDWNVGYSAEYYMTYVDAATWRDIETVDIVSARITRAQDGLRGGADIVSEEAVDTERWVRIWLDARQAGDAEHVALFTGLATSPANVITGAASSASLEAYSVLKPCDDVLLQRGWYVAAGVSCKNILTELLSNTPAPVEWQGDVPPLKQAIVAEDSETALTMVDKILAALDWRLVIAGDGVITIGPKSDNVVATFDALENDSIEPDITIEQDLFSVPNVLRAVSGDLVAIARDDSADSALSTVNRGREVWAEEDNVDLSEEMSIEEYAIKRLKVLQTAGRAAKYKRRYNPDITVTDTIRLNYPEHGLVGEYKIVSQSLTADHGVTVEEEAQA